MTAVERPETGAGVTAHGSHVELDPASRTFAQRCGIHDAQREESVRRVAHLVESSGLELVRIVWCDQHGITRGKTLTAKAALRAMRDGLGMVSTLMLKDTSDRTAFKVFEPGGTAGLDGFSFANNLVLLPDPQSFRQLPWTQGTGWMQAQPWFQDAKPVELDTRRILQSAISRLSDAGLAMRCGLEVEFHIYRIENEGPQLDPELAEWPGQPPHVSMVHPGYNLLAESWADMAEEPLRIVQRTAQALGLPLCSLEIELGPSQVEAVFEPSEALTAADDMVLFRSAARQALRRAGYHATFMCRPPFPNIMSSGWHLHQSLVDSSTGANATSMSYLAGLLEHARAMAVFCTPTANGYGRFRPNALAPQAVVWGRDNRGAMLRVIGEPGDAGFRIENRIGEPAANPYLYFASQIHAGLDGIERKLQAPAPTEAPYAPAATMLPTSLGEALEALRGDTVLTKAFGPAFIDYYTRIKQAELARFDAAEDKQEFQRREYFGRF